MSKDEEKTKVIFFKDDIDFINQCVDPNMQFHTIKGNNNDDIICFDIKMTPLYDKYIADGMKLCIEDPKSLIMKRQCVNYRTCSQHIDNLVSYDSLLH